METADQVIAIHRKAMENQKKVIIDKACEWIQCMVLDYMQGDITDVKWGGLCLQTSVKIWRNSYGNG